MSLKDVSFEKIFDTDRKNSSCIKSFRNISCITLELASLYQVNWGTCLRLGFQILSSLINTKVSIYFFGFGFNMLRHSNTSSSKIFVYISRPSLIASDGLELGLKPNLKNMV